MGMKYSWYSGLATVDLRISGNFPNWWGINKGVFDLPKQMLKSIFYSPTPKNLDNPEKFVFPELSKFSSAGRKKWIADLESTPQKTFIKKEKGVLFYMCIKYNNTVFFIASLC